MTFIGKTVFYFGALSALAACDPAIHTVNFNALGTAKTEYDPGTATLTIRNVEVTDPFNDEVVSNTNSSIYFSAADDLITSVSSDTSGADGVYALVASSYGDSTNFTGVAAGTTGDAFVPVSGTATYTGDYTGIVQQTPDGGDQSAFVLIYGDVTLNADFGDATIDGSITNRNVTDLTGVDLLTYDAADVTLESTDINPDGTFDYNATGGELISTGIDTWETNNGEYAGIIGGASGEFAAGVLIIDQDVTSLPTTTEYTEVGTFVAHD